MGKNEYLFGLAPPYKEYFFKRPAATQLSVSEELKELLARICTEEFFPDRSFENRPDQNELKELFRKKFDYRLLPHQCEEYPYVFSRGNLEKILTNLNTVNLNHKSALPLLHHLLCSYLQRAHKMDAQKLPTLGELFVARIKPDDDGSPPPLGSPVPDKPVQISLKVRGLGTAPFYEVTEDPYLSNPAPKQNPVANQEMPHSSSTAEDLHQSAQRTDSFKNVGTTSRRASVGILCLAAILLGYVSMQTETFESVVSDHANPVTQHELLQKLQQAENNAAKFPESAQAQFEFAHLLDEDRQLSRAAYFYQRAIDNDPSNVRARNNLARLKILLGDAATAAIELQHLLTRFKLRPPEKAYISKNLSWAYIEQNQFSSAETLIDELLLAPEFEDVPGIRASAHCLLALSNRRRDRPWNAQAQFCLSSYEGDSRVYLESSWVTQLSE